MGKVLPEGIGPKEKEFIDAQKVFFVATAPLDAQHVVSVSPKCQGAVVLDANTVMYGDLTGSGSETAAHVLQNQRMTLLFCNLERGPPKILRLSGKAQVLLAQDAPPALKQKLPQHVAQHVGFRAIYKLHVTRVSTSCGYALPVFEFVKHRTVLDDVSQKLHDGGDARLWNYQTKKNSFSIDGLPSLALLRPGMDADHVAPVREDGYVFGKKKEDVVVAVDDSTEDEDETSQEDHGNDPKSPSSVVVASKQDIALLQQKYRTSRRELSTIGYDWNLVAVFVLVFAMGIAVGLQVAASRATPPATM